MDTHLNMELQVITVCKSGFYYLRELGKIRKYLSLASAKTMVHARVTKPIGFQQCHTVWITEHTPTTNSESRKCSCTDRHFGK